MKCDNSKTLFLKIVKLWGKLKTQVKIKKTKKKSNFDKGPTLQLWQN